MIKMIENHKKLVINSHLAIGTTFEHHGAYYIESSQGIINLETGQYFCRSFFLFPVRIVTLECREVG